MTLDEFYSFPLRERVDKMEVLDVKPKVGEDGEIITLKVKYGKLSQKTTGRYVEVGSGLKDARL